MEARRAIDGGASSTNAKLVGLVGVSPPDPEAVEPVSPGRSHPLHAWVPPARRSRPPTRVGPGPAEAATGRPPAGTGKKLAELLARQLGSGDRVRRIVARQLGGRLTDLAMLFGAHEASERTRAPPDAETWKRARCSFEQIRRLAEDLARGGPDLGVHLTDVYVGPVVASVCDLHASVASREGVVLRTEIQGSPPRVRADRGRFVQGLSNLVQVGIRLTPERGEVVVRVRPSASGVQVVVGGSGPDNHPEERSRWGLALAIARECVEAQGGSLTVAGRGPGGGVSLPFNVELPEAAPDEGEGDPDRLRPWLETPVGRGRR